MYTAQAERTCTPCCFLSVHDVAQPHSTWIQACISPDSGMQLMLWVRKGSMLILCAVKQAQVFVCNIYRVCYKVRNKVACACSTVCCESAAKPRWPKLSVTIHEFGKTSSSGPRPSGTVHVYETKTSTRRDPGDANVRLYSSGVTRPVINWICRSQHACTR